VRSRAVSCRKDFPRDDECCSVRAKVEKELREDVDGEEAVGGDAEVHEAHYGEEDGEDSEAHELDGLAADGVDCCYGHPIAGNGTGENNNHVADGGVVQVLVGGCSAGGRVSDCRQDGCVI